MIVKRNVVVTEIMVYIVAIVTLFEYGERLLSELSKIENVGFVDMASIICFVTSEAMFFVLRPISLIVDIWGYFEYGK